MLQTATRSSSKQKHERVPDGIHLLCIICCSVPSPLLGSDGELSGHCSGRNSLLFVWWTAPHHPQFNWTHSHLWKTTFWFQQVRLVQTGTKQKSCHVNLSLWAPWVWLPSQELWRGLHGAPFVDRPPLVSAVFFSGSVRCQLHHQVHDPLHGGGFLQPHLFHIHLWCHQEDGE